MAAPDDDEALRKATRLWHERFGRDPAPPVGQGRATRLLLLALAAAMLIGGLTWRSRRLAAGPVGATPPAGEALVRELELEGAAKDEFLTRWRAWRRQEDELRGRERQARELLGKLAGQETDLNLEQERLLLELRDVAHQRLAGREELVDQVRDQWGLWRASRLAVRLAQDPFRP